MGELENCPRCGQLFVKTMRDVCQDCYKEEEKKFQIVYEFMKKRINRQATIPEIVKGTGVEEDIIVKFVKEKRLRSAQFPNLTYPCERCGAEIAEGKLCEACSNDLSNDLKHEEQVLALEERKKEAERAKQRTYFAVDRHKDRN